VVDFFPDLGVLAACGVVDDEVAAIFCSDAATSVSTAPGDRVRSVAGDANDAKDWRFFGLSVDVGTEGLEALLRAVGFGPMERPLAGELTAGDAERDTTPDPDSP
jgi:hypothetical protein